MAAIGASGHLAAGISPLLQRRTTSYGGGTQKCRRIVAVSSTERKRIEREKGSFGENGRLLEQRQRVKEKEEESEVKQSNNNIYAKPEELPEVEEGKKGLKDYFEESKELIKSDGGPPRWFTPLDCCSSSASPNSPLLLYLPGIDGTGLGLIMHHHKLGKMFNVWCLHIPVKDRTPFTGLVKVVERAVRSENYKAPNRPIYIVGESLGACIALVVAAHNPDIDLVLVLSNPATSFSKSQLQPLIPLMGLMPDNFPLNLPHLATGVGDPLRMLIDNVVTRGILPQNVGELSQDLVTMSSYFLVLGGILPRETLMWKLDLLKHGSERANSRLHSVKAQMLILFSGRDQLLPSKEESQRIQKTLPDCEIRMFEESGHFLFMEHSFDLVTVIKGASFYRQGKHYHCASDYIPPTPTEFKKIYKSVRWFVDATGPVMLSTLEDGKVVRGLGGIPSEGPVLLVGYHMLMGVETIPLVAQMLIERNIVLRGIAHPALFLRVKDRTPEEPDPSNYDVVRVMGAVPVSPQNLYKLMASKSHILLYPGGMREAVHRKGEEYKLFWPEQSEFVRMAATFGAKIVPFGAVGEDDFAEIILDYNDLMKIPWTREEIERLTNRTPKARTNATGEVANQQMHIPWMLPKFPGRFYYYFGKPIETQGMKGELRDRDKSHELYLHIKSEVEGCLAYLKDKREKDPYRYLLSRLLYQATHGHASTSPFQIPTFDL